ncbi:MAG: potassium transporter TrkA [Myxococcales bacterium]|nr:potassium transporter TrkA [Myxococcales bacterium]
MGIRQRLRYRFDNWMARGVGAQILLLALFTVVLVLITAILIVVFDVVPADEQGAKNSFGMLSWKALMHALDPGTLSGDSASWTLLFILLFVTIGGLFVLSALIGILNQGFGAMIESWRRGKSRVIERGHTVILGWGPKVFTLLRELAIANQNQRNACVVVLADRDKVEMDQAVAEAVRGTRLRVVTRRGSTMAPSSLELVNLEASKAVVVIAPEVDAQGHVMVNHESDTIVLKTLLALAKVSPARALHVVAEILDERTEAVARMVAGEKAALVLASPLISRLLVQTGRQSGLSAVYTELLDFAGMEIYVQPQKGLTNKTFREGVFAYETSSLIGVITVAGELLLPPDPDRRFHGSDHIIVISEDDDTITLDARPTELDDRHVIAAPAPVAPRPERTLVLGGSSPRLSRVLSELDAYVASGSSTLVVAEGEATLPALRNMTISLKRGEMTDRGLLEALAVIEYDHVLVLSESSGRTQEMADARTTVALLHLRDIARRADCKLPITSEILDIENRDLASVAEADDFIVSNTLVSLMMSQISENPHLVGVFDELFTAGGYELYLKPSHHYVEDGERPFALVCEAALRRKEIAIGYRLANHARDAERGFGVVVNPPKRVPIPFGDGDKIIVLAES